MADIVLHGVTPQPGDVLSVPIAVQYGLAQGGLVVGEPTDATCPAWDEAGDQGPIAEGSRAHIFVAPAWHPIQNATLGTIYSDGDFLLDILNTIRSIKSNNMPLSNFAAKLGNAYCYDYTNPYTRGCAVSLTDKDYSGMKTRFSMTRIGLASGRIDASGYNASNYGTWYYKIASALASSGWTQDGVNKSNMYEGFSKDISTGDVYRYDINNTKSALDPADVETHTVEVYRGIFFAEDPYNAGELSAGDILVVVDWDDEMEYTIYDGDDPDTGLPTTTTTLGPKATFAIGWRDPGSYNTRLQVSQDPDYEYSRMIDLYPPAAAEEFNFIALGGGGGGGNKGRGGRGVSSSIPIRITSRGDVDYRHYLDLYDETNYNERNMFLTNFVGRIPYRYIDYDSSEGGGTGIVRVETDLQFTHFVGMSFSDDNVPRVYEVVSHKDLGGNPKTLLCTFKVCHLKDYFQHFGVTAENEFLVERSTHSGLYNPWLKDPRIFSEDYAEEAWDYGTGGLSMSNLKALITLTDGRAVVMPLTSPSPGYSHTGPSTGPTNIPTMFYQATSLEGICNCVNDVDSDPKSELYTVSLINAVLSKIKGVYLVSGQMFAGQGTSGSHVQVWFNMSYFTDSSDRENSLVEQLGIFEFSGTVIEDPTIPITYNVGFLGPGRMNDWTDLEANYRMIIPWYGIAEVSGTELKRYLDHGSGLINVQYFISSLDGTISVSLEGATGRVTHQWKNLPKLPVPSSCKTTAYRQTAEQIVRQSEIQDKQAWVQGAASLGAGVVGAVVATATGNPLAGLGALGAGAAGAVSTVISSDLRHKSAAIGSEIAASSIVFNSTSCDGFEMLSFATMRIIKVKKTEILNVYSAIGYPCRCLWRSVGAVNGKKYWVSILGNIKGTSAYAQAVRGEIERDGIIYNYT